MKRIRIFVVGIVLLGTFLGGFSLYEFLHTEPEPVKSVDQIKKLTGEKEIDSPGAKKLEKDYWSMINGCLGVYSETQLQKKETIEIPATYEGEKVHSFDISCREGDFSTYLKHVEIELHNRGYKALICNTIGISNREQDFIDFMQRKAIDFLEKSGRLYSLPEELLTAAMLRKNNPELTLKELCRISPDALTVSGLNHRLKKIIDLYHELSKE